MTHRLKSTALALLLLGLLTAYAYASTHLFSAHRAASSNTMEGLESAVRLAPWNADYSFLLARSRTLGLLDFPGGIAEYQRALALNPYSSRGWLDLAAAYQMAGDSEKQSFAMEQAVKVDPHTPNVAWEVASFYILQDKVKQALPHYRTVLSSQKTETPAVLDIIWPATHHDANVIIDEALPADSEVYAAFLDYASRQKDLTAARVVWQRLAALRPALAPKVAFSYIRLLLEANEPAEALRVWKELATLQPTLSDYVPDKNNLVVNGDFESDLLGGGLEWSLVKQPNVELRTDILEFHGGNRSLSATFEASRPASLGLSQLIPVEGGRQYRFSVFAKADELTTASGPRISISDAYTDERLFLSDDLRGTTGWKEISSLIRVPAQTSALRLTVVREPAPPLIKGRLYLDDLVLRPAD